tara:strand:+ start:86 stop:250 length:165 start_codon:yes stop_codon:yes gene_type:complete
MARTSEEIFNTKLHPRQLIMEEEIIVKGARTHPGTTLSLTKATGQAILKMEYGR